MARSYETVRTDLLAYLANEAVPDFRKPQHCSMHRVQWWSDDLTRKETEAGRPLCPCCTGEMPLRMLMDIEADRISRLRQRASRATPHS